MHSGQLWASPGSPLSPTVVGGSPVMTGAIGGMSVDQMLEMRTIVIQQQLDMVKLARKHHTSLMEYVASVTSSPGADATAPHSSTPSPPLHAESPAPAPAPASSTSDTAHTGDGAEP